VFTRLLLLGFSNGIDGAVEGGRSISGLYFWMVEIRLLEDLSHQYGMDISVIPNWEANWILA
jgi:hypothetical protein